MKAGESVNPNHPIKLREGRLGPAGCREIVSGGENMGCVETDLQALAILHSGQDRRDFLEARSEAGTLTGCCFQSDAHLQIRVLGVQPVEIANNTGDAGLDARAEMGAGVEDKRADAKLLTAKHLVG